MTGQFSDATRGWVFFAGLFVLLLACDGSEGDCGSDSDDCDSPDPSEVASDPVDDWFRIVSFSVPTSDVGIDLDGDGDVDNQIGNTLAALNQAVYEAIEAAVCAGEPCSEPEQAALDQVQQVLDGLLSISALNDALEEPIQDFAVDDMTNMKGDSLEGELTLRYYEGLATTSGFTAEDLLCEQTGHLDETGSGLFGTCQTSIPIAYFSPPGGGEPLVIYVAVYQAITEIEGYTFSRYSFYLGGVIPLVDLMAAVGEILQVLDAIVPDGLPVEEILAMIEGSIAGTADFDLDGDGEPDGFSMCLLGAADAALVTTP